MHADLSLPHRDALLGRRERLVMALAAALAVVVYAQTVGFDFVYDDIVQVRDKDLIHSLANWRQILVSTWWGDRLYRPFTQLTFAVDWTLGGGSPSVFHAVNALLHGAVTALVYLLGLRVLGGSGATAVALLFAVHPVHVEAVANVVGRAELLAALFALGAVLAYARHGERVRAGRAGRHGAAYLSLGCLLLALGSKESAFAIPGLLLVTDWIEARRMEEPFAVRARRQWPLWAAAVVISLAWLMLRAAIVGGLAGDRPAPGLRGEGLVGRGLAMAPVVVEYVRLFFFPARLSVDYGPDFLPVTPFVTARGVAGLGVVAIGVLGAWLARRRAPGVAFALAWLAATLLVVSNLIVPSGVVLAERTLYLASVGAVLLVGWGVMQLGQRWRRTALGVLGVLGVLGTAQTLLRQRVWRDQDRLLEALVRDAPGSYRAYWTEGAFAYRDRRYAEAEQKLLRAAATYPLDPGPWIELAHLMEAVGRWREAGQYYGVAFAIDTMAVERAAEGVVAYLRAGMTDSAAALGARGRARFSHEPAMKIALADIAMAQGRPLEALAWRRQVVWQYPGVWQYRYLVGDAAAAAGACRELDWALLALRQLSPGVPQVAELEERRKAAGCEP